MDAYKRLVSLGSKLYDFSATDPERKKTCAKDWGVKMSTDDLD